MARRGDGLVWQAADACVTAYAEAPTMASNSTEVRIAYDVNRLLWTIAFRGTDEPGDWLDNARAVPWWMPGVGWVHKGFLRSMEALEEELLLVMAMAPYPVLVCGHSKGGAEATLFTARAIMRDCPPIGLVTFGAPRCGVGSSLARVINPVVPTWRFESGADGVVHVPWILGLYRHHVEPLRLEPNPDNPRPRLVSDHKMANYAWGLEHTDWWTQERNDTIS